MTLRVDSFSTQADPLVSVATGVFCAGLMKMISRTLLVLVGVMVASGANATWFTLTGDPAMADEDTVEVEVNTLNTVEQSRTLLIRVNRETDRTSWDGVAYRSYTAQIVFECSVPAAYYQSITFFKQPLWLGEPLTVAYGQQPRREVQFLAMQPNPASRLVRAACNG